MSIERVAGQYSPLTTLSPLNFNLSPRGLEVTGFTRSPAELEKFVEQIMRLRHLLPEAEEPTPRPAV